MSLSVGIVGLPNVGKSTLFNALTSSATALAANYPFATIEPNVGIVGVPDSRLDVLEKMYEAEKKVPAAIKFVDIAGLVEGASKGEGLGNKFLAHIREVDVIIQVVRVFKNPEVLVALGAMFDVSKIQDDIEIIRTELELADYETVSKMRARKGFVESELDEVPLMTKKPVIYMFNMDEAELVDGNLRAELAGHVAPAEAVFVNAKLEEEMVGLSTEEKMEFLASYGISEDGLSQLVSSTYRALGLQSFLTAGKKEVRAWTVRQGATAPEAAGVIHTDFQRGFIAASVMNYDDLVRLGSEKAVKEAGLLRTEGKEYVMREGDVVEFRFNV
jgi:ribosome-binding ATPase YchF (GTP1/OBG family)